MKRFILALALILTCVSAHAQKPTKEEKKAEREERARVRDSIYIAETEARINATLKLRGYDIAEKKHIENVKNNIDTIPSPFKVQGISLVWQNIQPLKIEREDILKSLLLSNNFRDIIQIDANTIIGEIKPFVVFPALCGFSYEECPRYLQNYAFGEAFFILEIKEDKYRVTVKDIRLTEVISYPENPEGRHPFLYLIAVKEGKLNPLFRKYAEKVYDLHLKMKFSISLPDTKW
jgi:hypothetical protein